MKTRSDNKVLIVAYHFPPDAAVGALRPQKFVKYLPEFGWQPYVLTIKERFIDKRDDARLADVKQAEICRADYWRTPLKFLLDLRDSFRIGAKRPTLKADDSPNSSGQTPAKSAKSLFSSLKNFLVLLNWLPDDKINWVIPATIAGYRIIKRNKIDCIVASLPPHTDGIIGMLLAKLTGVRLVLDMRDPWMLSARPPDSPDTLLHYKLDSFLERMVFTSADSFVVTTARFENYLRDVRKKDRVFTIPNGYDETDFAALSRSRTDSKFVITYLGTIYLERSPRATLAAVRQLIDDKVIDRQDIQVRFVGDVISDGARNIEQLSKKYELDDVVMIQGMIPYPAALQEMVDADVLLLLAPNQPYQIPAKAFDYIGAKRPILALTEDGATADLIKTVKVGKIVGPEDVDGIKAAITEFYQEWKNVSLFNEGSDSERFARRQLTCEFANVLNEMI